MTFGHHDPSVYDLFPLLQNVPWYHFGVDSRFCVGLGRRLICLSLCFKKLMWANPASCSVFLPCTQGPVWHATHSWVSLQDALYKMKISLMLTTGERTHFLKRFTSLGFMLLTVGYKLRFHYHFAKLIRLQDVKHSVCCTHSHWQVSGL